VHVSSRDHDHDLSEAFRNPAPLPASTNLVAEYRSLAVDRRSSMNRNALFISQEIDRALCCYLVFITLVGSLVAGVIVATLSQRLDLAIATVAAVAGWVGCVEGVLLWMYR